MTKKANTTVKINCEDEMSAQILFSYFEAFADEVTGQVRKTYAQAGGGATDPSFEELDHSKLTMKLRLIPQDKGDVFILDENKELSVVSYKDLADEELYGIITSGKLVVMERNTNGLDKGVARIDGISHLQRVLLEAPAEIARQKLDAATKVEAKVEEIEEVDTVKDYNEDKEEQ